MGSLTFDIFENLNSTINSNKKNLNNNQIHMKKLVPLKKLVPFTLVVLFALTGAFAQKGIIHDAEYYILEAQNGKKWAVEDGDIDKKLKELKKKYKTSPNIIHFMWDDQPVGAVGIPALQKIRGYETPVLNKMAQDGILFTRMYTEPGCTPSLSLIHISEPTRPPSTSRMPSSA